MNLPMGPAFITPLQAENGGVDYLGLREANLQLMSEFLPGINNVTKEIRPYSVMCWLALAFLSGHKVTGRASVNVDEFNRFREKVEILFNWSHTLENAAGGMVGNTQKRPPESGTFHLAFAAWNRNVSWLDAANYGPSLKGESGLGFLGRDSSGIFFMHPSGKALANALGAELQQCGPAYTLLASVTEFDGTDDLARALYPGWRRDKTSLAEVAVFREAFYVPEEIRKARESRERTAAARRSVALELVQACLLQSGEALTVDEIRQTMTWMVLPESAFATDRNALDRAQALWRTLQMRQAQRLAFEALFSWCEQRVRRQEAQGSDELVDGLLACLANGEGTTASADWAAATLARYAASKQEPGHVAIPGYRGDPDADIFANMAALLNAIHANDEQAAPTRAIHILLLVVTGTDAMSQDPFAEPYLGVGGSARVSLRDWGQLVHGRVGELRSFLHVLVESFVLSQHFGVAALRSGGNKSRLRLSLDEGGLVSLVPNDKPWTPGLTPDRLEAALNLMADCGLLKRTPTVAGEGARYSYQS